MTIATGQATVDTSATSIVAANSSRIKVTIRNRSGVSIYLGGSGVTTSNGLLLRSGEDFIDTMFTGQIYGIAGSGSNTITYIEED